MRTATSRLAPGAAVAAAIAAMTATPEAHADHEGWSVEITPYIWATGVDGDVTVRGRSVSVDKSFDELLEAVDIGAALLLKARIRRVLVFAQIDYYELSTDELDQPPARGTLDTDVFMATLAAGYLFGSERHNLGVGLGARTLSLDNTLRLDGIGSFDKSSDVTDPLLLVIPSFQLSDRWRFNPAFAYGTGGDSEETYELQPQFMFQISDHITMRFGYRRVYYDIANERDNRWDGSMQGAFVGVGGAFGSER